MRFLNIGVKNGKEANEDNSENNDIGLKFI